MAISRRAHLLAVALMVVALLVSSVGASPTRAQDQGSAGNPNAASEARQTAIGKVAKDYGVEAGNLRATEPELWIYDPALLGGPGLQVPQLVWRTEVTDGGSGRDPRAGAR
jgi:hypothetical protein